MTGQRLYQCGHRGCDLHGVLHSHVRPWPTWRQWARRVLHVAGRATARSLLLGGILEIYIAVRGGA